MEFLLTDKSDDKVLFRRNSAIWMAMHQFRQVSAEGYPYVAPEWQLLFKAKNPRAKDEEDFFNHAPCLTVEAKRWLLSALKIHVPESGWVLALEWMLNE